MGLVLKAIHRIHGFFGSNSEVMMKNKVSCANLKRKVLIEKKKDIQKLKQANGKIKVMVEKAEIEFRIVKSNKK